MLSLRSDDINSAKADSEEEWGRRVRGGDDEFVKWIYRGRCMAGRELGDF